MRLAALISLALAFATPAAAENCPQGLIPVYWQESSGLEDEPWRDTYVFETGLPPPNTSLVLHYDPEKKKAEWVDGHTSGTNIHIFGLVPLDEAGKVLPFRWAEIVGDEISPLTVRGKAVTALIVDMHIYWPVCAKRETVEAWKKLAGPPPS